MTAKSSLSSFSSLAGCLRTAAQQLTTALPVRRSLFVFRPPDSENLRGRNGGSSADRRTGRGFEQRFAHAGSALLFGAAFLIGGAPAAGAGTLTFTFSDDGANSTITVNGSLDLIESAFGEPSDVNSQSGSRTLLLNYANEADSHWQISESNGYACRHWSLKNFTVSGLDTYSGKPNIDMGISYESDIYVHINQAGQSFYLNLEIDHYDTTARSYIVEHEIIAFDGTLKEVL